LLLVTTLLWSGATSLQSEAGLPLNDYIRHFEPAFYTINHHQTRLHQLDKRSIGEPTKSYHDSAVAAPLSFNVTAHNRLFRIKLHCNFAQAHDIFADDAVVESTDGLIDATGIRNRIYSGILEDSPTSTVQGILTKDGLFDGHISTSDEDFYIEPASRYFPPNIEEDPPKSRPFHSVIYKASDVIHPLDANSELHTPCKSHEVHLKRKELEAKASTSKVPTSSSTSPKTSFSSVIRPKKQRIKRQLNHLSDEAFDPSEKEHDSASQLFENLPDSSHMKGGSPIVNSTSEKKRSEVGWSIRGLGNRGQWPRTAKQIVTTYEIVDWEDVPESVKHHFRKRSEARRKAANREGIIDKKRKTCMLYLQADHLFYEAMGFDQEACIEAMTRHVQRVNSIYEPIDFDQDGKADNIRFMIKRIKVHTEKALEDKAYRFPGNYGVEKFLEIFSEENYDAFCLAYMFTYRDFEGGTLGLAWTGDMKNAGGVCERNGHYRGTLKSLNTGIITLLNYGKHVPPAVSHVTMAHEMGHNFGSPHDPENNKACVPGGEDGNYIMFARATSGDKSNNRKFSPCSLKSIKPVLLSKAIGPKGCFQEPKKALCGNGVVEAGEECDCGWEEDCDEDCCWPQRTTFPPHEKPCTLKPKRDCSPSQGPCCTNTCSFKLGEKCLDDNGCREESFCDGTSPNCPLSEVRPNKTVCNKEFVCYKGECTGSICLAYGLESCQCTQGPGDTATKACELCCKEPGDGKPCNSSFELNQAPLDVPDMFSKPGSPCNNYQGYCDVFQKCREVDPSGPLATLRKLLLSEESIANLKRFLMRYWYTVIFIVLAVFILMAVIIKICGKKTPLVRSRRKRRRHTNTQQQEVEGIDNPDNVQVHPTTVEAAVPLGKKVRKGQSKDSRKKSKSRSRGRSGGRKVSKSQDRSPPTSTTNTTPTSSSNNHEAAAANIEAGGNSVEDGVARAVRLAANLSNQLFVDLPPEASNTNNVSTRASLEPPSHYEDVIVEPRKSRTKAKKATKVRKHKSLSPEKRLATTLAQSMSSISKSFEKLDLVGRGRGQQRQPLHSASSEQQPQSSHKKRRRSRQQQNQEQPSKQKEVTIAKLGRFKFSVEVAKQFDEELSKPSAKGQKGRSEKSEQHKTRKISNISNKTKTNENSEKVTRKESSVAKLPSIHVTNFNAQKEPSAQLPFNAPSVIVSKKRKERPRRQNSESPEKIGKNAVLDYRRSFGGTSEKFSRSISVPGPAPTLEEIQEHGSGQSQPQPPRLRRSETMVQKAYEHHQLPQAMAASTSSHSWVAEFDNHAYAKSPCNEQKEAENSLSLTSLTNEEETNANNVSFHCSSSSTDSDLEVVTNKPPPISRAKILETVGVIVNNPSSSVAASNSAANLLLPPSSSPTSASSGATSPSIASSAGPDEPRLAFIGCETTASTLSSPLSGGSAASSNKRPSLSERYPTSPSSASTGSTASTGSSKRDHEEEDLDIISIMTDGMT